MIDRIDLVELDVPLARSFSISRSTTERIEPLILRVDDGEHVGFGEAHASPEVTGESPKQARDALASLDPGDIDPGDPEASLSRLEGAGPAARAALDLALVDLVGKQRGEPAHELLGWPDGVKPSAATVTLTDPDGAAQQARAWVEHGYTRIKVKVGREEDALDIVDAVTDAVPDTVRDPMPDPEVWVDANEAWTPEGTTGLLPKLDERGVALLEQPLPRGEEQALAEIVPESPIPIVADESVQGAEDVRALASVEGPLWINVKVQKVGGLRAARACVEAAQEMDRGLLVGCNIETGLGIAAGACLTGIADEVDLDGNLFLERDPFPLPRPMPGHVGTLEGAGLGVHPHPRFPRLTAYDQG